MKVLILYRPNSEHARGVEEFVHDYRQRDESSQLELLSVETKEGSAAATLYDVVQYPTILVLRADGSLIRAWSGETMPLMDEVAAYARGE